jgi:hypothetical protein
MNPCSICGGSGANGILYSEPNSVFMRLSFANATTACQHLFLWHVFTTRAIVIFFRV